MFVHLHNPQQSRCPLRNPAYQCSQLRDLFICVSVSRDNSSKLRVEASRRSSIVIAASLFLLSHSSRRKR